ncbi:MAG: FAD-binding protein [Flavobacteriales bacterium]|nr:FAD-binding protein [Flavobacteriales bacterium]
MEWKNWAGNIRFTPGRIAQPGSTDEVVRLLRNAAAEGRKVRCIGTGHSWSALAETRDILVNTDRLNRIISADANTGQVVVEAGAKLKDLNVQLWERGLAFANLGSIAEQSLAGAVSTATHGSGTDHRILASQIQRFTLVRPDGEVQLIDAEQDSELFNTAIISLGALGIITEMTLKAVPRYQLHEQSGLMEFEDVCSNVLDWVKEHDHLKLWWFPHTDRMMVYRYDRTQQPVNDSRLRQKLMDEWLSVSGYRLMLWWADRKPGRRKWVNRQIVRHMLPDVDRIERSYKVFNVPEPPIHRETEWAFDIGLTPRLLREYRDMVNANGHLINFIQEIRFVKGDDYALSPCHGRDSVYVGAYNADDRGWNELLSDFGKLAMDHRGRPHWGKEFNVGIDYLRSVYPQWERFVALRNAYDPERRLSNAMMERLFGR